MAEQQDKKYLALYRSYRRTLAILDPFREDLMNIKADISDEGDRAYFGSTNQADQFKEIADTLDALQWDELMQPAHKDASDLYQELYDAKDDAARLHTEKMAFFEKLVATRTVLAELVGCLEAEYQGVAMQVTKPERMAAARAILQPLT